MPPTPEEIAAQAAEDAKTAAEKLAAEEAAKAEKKESDFETWLAKQPADVQKLYEEKTGSLKSALDKERDANKTNKAALKELEVLKAAEAKRKQEELSETDKLKAQLTEEATKRETAEKTLLTERVKTQILSEANKPVYGDGKKKFVSPEVAYKLLDISKLEIEDGKATGIDEALKKLAKENPFLLEQVDAGSGAGSPGRGRQGFNQNATQKQDYKIPRI